MGTAWRNSVLYETQMLKVRNELCSYQMFEQTSDFFIVTHAIHRNATDFPSTMRHEKITLCGYHQVPNKCYGWLFTASMFKRREGNFCRLLLLMNATVLESPTSNVIAMHCDYDARKTTALSYANKVMSRKSKIIIPNWLSFRPASITYEALQIDSATEIVLHQ
jgi:hypothetical protein